MSPAALNAQAVIAGRQGEDGASADVERLADRLIARRRGQYLGRERRPVGREHDSTEPPLAVIAPGSEGTDHEQDRGRRGEAGAGQRLPPLADVTHDPLDHRSPPGLDRPAFEHGPQVARQGLGTLVPLAPAPWPGTSG